MVQENHDPQQQQKYSPFATSTGDDGEPEMFAHDPISMSIAVAEEVDESILHRKELFCGCCCDYRLAVIVINAIFVFVLTLVMVADKRVNMRNCDLLFFGFAYVALNAAGFYGALRYQRWGVMLGGMAQVLGIVADSYILVSTLVNNGSKLEFTTGPWGRLNRLVMDFVFLHAHATLLRLMNEGVMTPRNYPNVAYCILQDYRPLLEIQRQWEAERGKAQV